VGACMAWYGWTQRARVLIFHMPPYSPPPLYLAGAIAVIVLLILAAYTLPQARRGNSQVGSSTAPSPLLAGSVVTTLGSAWAAFVLLGFGSLPAIPFLLALAAGVAWCGLTLFLMRRWTSSSNWGDTHRFALVFGGILGCMLGGFAVFKVGGALRIDWIGKAILNVAAVAWLITIGRTVAGRTVNSAKRVTESSR